MPHDHSECINRCRTCHETCLITIQYCLSQGGQHSAVDHIKLLQDCVQICQTSLDFMLRDSSHHGETCRACAVICEACAEDCATMEDDEKMGECAKVCRACAESCQQMAMHHGVA